MDKKCVVFSGQGSQYVGMGEKLFIKYPEYLLKANEIMGFSIEKFCKNESFIELSKTEFTQPLLYVINALSYYDYIESNNIPDYVIGHSLGEYNALLAANVFDFEVGLKLTKKRGQLFSEIKDGGMLAVLGENAHAFVHKFIENHANVFVANYNSNKQVILSGELQALNLIKADLECQKIRCLFLNVSGAFHSDLMIKAKNKFEDYLHGFRFNSPIFQVSSNYNNIKYTKDNIKDLLVQQIVCPVQWQNQIETLIDLNVTDFIELGAKPVLASIILDVKSNYKSEIVHESDSIVAFDNETSNLPNVKPNIGGGVLGSESFKKRYGLDYAYVTGGMYKGIASLELVERMTNSNMLSFLGVGGQDIEVVVKEIEELALKFKGLKHFGVNYIYTPNDIQYEYKLVDILFKNEVRVVEASAFSSVTMPLVYYRVKGARFTVDKKSIEVKNHVIAKLSHPKLAEMFLKPASKTIIDKLLNSNLISEEEAIIASMISVASDITVEADSGGHTDQKNPLVLLPRILEMRDSISKEYPLSQKVHIGLGGGIGTAKSIIAAFSMGADFVLTGSINQCTVQAKISDRAKEVLSKMDVYETAMSPAGDMFEIGAKTQVFSKQNLFHIKSSKLYDMYKKYNSIEEVPVKEIEILERDYFYDSIQNVWENTKNYLELKNKTHLQKIENNAKLKMAQIFKWYFILTMRYSQNGDEDKVSDYQLHTGPSLGAFNDFVKGTKYEIWQNRNVDEIGIYLMNQAALLLIKI